MNTLPLALLLGACWSENLPQVNLGGTVVLPRAAATREVSVVDANGEVTGTEERTDVRFIGPVILGAFSGIDTQSFSYPHPSMGPVIGGAAGDTFPYGGTSVGRFDFACYEALACKVVTGRFTTYADILDYFKNELGSAVTDHYGTEVVDPSTFQQQCFDYYYATSDDEMSFIRELDFTENADGDFEAEYTLAQTTFVPGMALWGYMDTPGENGSFNTCDEGRGRQYTQYDQDFEEGAAYPDLLNLPDSHIGEGDWVGDGTTFVDSVDETPVITLGIQYREEE